MEARIKDGVSLITHVLSVVLMFWNWALGGREEGRSLEGVALMLRNRVVGGGEGVRSSEASHKVFAQYSSRVFFTEWMGGRKKVTNKAPRASLVRQVGGSRKRVGGMGTDQVEVGGGRGVYSETQD